MLANQINSKNEFSRPVRGSELFNSLKCIYLNFCPTAVTEGTTGTFQTNAYAYINVGHPVKEIIVKNIAWCDNGTGNSSQYDVGTVFGDIVNGGCLGTFNANNASTAVPHYATPQNVRHIYRTPKNINGSYQFWIQDLLGLPFHDLESRTIAQMALIIEFIAADGVVTDVSV